MELSNHDVGSLNYDEVINGKQVSEYRAPSWSWASLDGQIDFDVPRSAFRWTAEIISAKTTLKTPEALYGEVTDGFIIIRGPLLYASAWGPGIGDRRFPFQRAFVTDSNSGISAGDLTAPTEGFEFPFASEVSMMFDFGSPPWRSSAAQPGIICDGCEKIIEAIYNNCSDCVDFDYRPECILNASSTHPDHDFDPYPLPGKNDVLCLFLGVERRMEWYTAYETQYYGLIIERDDRYRRTFRRMGIFNAGTIDKDTPNKTCKLAEKFNAAYLDALHMSGLISRSSGHGLWSATQVETLETDT
jgi:hypothetical protein